MWKGAERTITANSFFRSAVSDGIPSTKQRTLVAVDQWVVVRRKTPTYRFFSSTLDIVFLCFYHAHPYSTFELHNKTARPAQSKKKNAQPRPVVGTHASHICPVRRKQSLSFIISVLHFLPTMHIATFLYSVDSEIEHIKWRIHKIHNPLCDNIITLWDTY